MRKSRSKSSPSSRKRAPKVCWKGYKMVGMKKKNGRKVPNCVPSGRG